MIVVAHASYIEQSTSTDRPVVFPGDEKIRLVIDKFAIFVTSKGKVCCYFRKFLVRSKTEIFLNNFFCLSVIFGVFHLAGSGKQNDATK
jgi:hypothetical protein